MKQIDHSSLNAQIASKRKFFADKSFSKIIGMSNHKLIMIKHYFCPLLLKAATQKTKITIAKINKFVTKYKFVSKFPKLSLFVGAPGNGKTYFSSSLQNECNYSIKVFHTHFCELFQFNISSESLNNFYEICRASAPAILILDELEYIYPKIYPKNAYINIAAKVNEFMDFVIYSKHQVAVILLSQSINIPTSFISKLNKILHFPFPKEQEIRMYFNHLQTAYLQIKEEKTDNWGTFKGLSYSDIQILFRNLEMNRIREHLLLQSIKLDISENKSSIKSELFTISKFKENLSPLDLDKQKMNLDQERILIKILADWDKLILD